MRQSCTYRFRVIASYLSKVVDFNPLNLRLAPPSRSIFAEIFGTRKLESLGYRVQLLA